MLTHSLIYWLKSLIREKLTESAGWRVDERVGAGVLIIHSFHVSKHGQANGDGARPGQRFISEKSETKNRP